tara:strand:- start:571 stop:900 length:330 start_codon:yes stop_codon:yes gene_type:complete
MLITDVITVSCNISVSIDSIETSRSPEPVEEKQEEEEEEVADKLTLYDFHQIPIGRGGFGSVFRVNLKKTGEPFACKMQELASKSERIKKMAVEEAKQHQRLRHRFIVA